MTSYAFAFGLGSGLILSAPTFLLACKFFTLSPFIVCPITSGLLGLFFGAAYQWNWGVGWPTGFGCTCANILSSIALVTLFLSENEFESSSKLFSLIGLTAASGLIGTYFGVKSEK